MDTLPGVTVQSTSLTDAEPGTLSPQEAPAARPDIETAPVEVTGGLLKYMGKNGFATSTSIAGVIELFKLFCKIDLDDSGTISAAEMSKFAKGQGGSWTFRFNWEDLPRQVHIALMLDNDNTSGENVLKLFKNIETAFRNRSELTFPDFLELAHPEASANVLSKMNELATVYSNKKLAKSSRRQKLSEQEQHRRE
eukprot:gene25294-30877_t